MMKSRSLICLLENQNGGKLQKPYYDCPVGLSPPVDFSDRASDPCPKACTFIVIDKCLYFYTAMFRKIVTLKISNEKHMSQFKI
jgi:hypothetical protein